MGVGGVVVVVVVTVLVVQCSYSGGGSSGSSSRIGEGVGKGALVVVGVVVIVVVGVGRIIRTPPDGLHAFHSHDPDRYVLPLPLTSLPFASTTKNVAHIRRCSSRCA